MGTFKLGLLAEYITILWYKIFFFKILKHRYKTHFGEIDIIALRNNKIVFIEVKARRKLDNNYTLLSNNQINRITRAAEYFLSKNTRYFSYEVRFDLVICQPYKFKIIKNAW